MHESRGIGLHVIKAINCLLWIDNGIGHLCVGDGHGVVLMLGVMLILWRST